MNSVSVGGRDECSLLNNGAQSSINVERWRVLHLPLKPHPCPLSRSRIKSTEDLSHTHTGVMGFTGKSTSELVEVKNKPSYLMQYFAAISVTMGALSLGTSLGYTSPASPQLMDNSTNSSLVITTEQNNWFSSTVNLGALTGGLLGGVCINTLGRRGTMLASVLPFLASWALVGFANNFVMLIVGRLLIGLCTGVTCIAVPTYIGEFSSPDIRGALGSCFQLMAVGGIEFAYVFGIVMSTWRGLAGICAIPPIIYLTLLLFVKESPIYLLSKGKEREAREALQYFRGKNYNIEAEMKLMRKTQDDAQQNKASLRDLKTPYILKPLLISCTLMVFQQLSGINAVLFNLNKIFKGSGSTLATDIGPIIVGAVLVSATVIASVLMDKAGRKILLVVSAAVMCLSLVALDIFFYAMQQDEVWAADKLSWLPLTSLIVFVTAFSVGSGPIPWLMMGELFSLNVRESASGLATMVNWSTSFLVTLTKGKTLQEITALFGGPVLTEESTEKKEDTRIETVEL
ncbi:Facilitated trehalose transporter Tret1-like 10 [Homarus americanus]|uniref:Facilitated trehalose transporter Tret1-like 10 n=1 Tax=Homarus americanus TaxID=6706 RepID=A0A8J5KD30_HOMAM|nr:Facilitated trehalose transporter Tret1-like 10 [Homarus americanus]